jgi:hypothetical protein
MLCYVMLCYVMLCYVMLCYVMLCYVMLTRMNAAKAVVQVDENEGEQMAVHDGDCST